MTNVKLISERLDYDHNQEDTDKACRINFDNMQDKIKDVIELLYENFIKEEADTPNSVIVEKLENQLSKRELAYFAFIGVKEKVGKDVHNQMMKQMFKKMMTE